MVCQSPSSWARPQSGSRTAATASRARFCHRRQRSAGSPLGYRRRDRAEVRGRGLFVVLTTRHPANTEALSRQIEEHGGGCLTVALDLSSQTSIAEAFQLIRAQAETQMCWSITPVISRAATRCLPELLEYISVEMFDVTQHIACRGPFLVARRCCHSCASR